MEQYKQIQLELLVAVRNHPNTPEEEFSQIFENSWLNYRDWMVSLNRNGLILSSLHKQIPGLRVFSLSPAGEYKITQLLAERADRLSHQEANAFVVTASRSSVPARV